MWTKNFWFVKQDLEKTEEAEIKLKIMASSPNTSKKIDGETMETVTAFILLGSKITANSDYSHEI